jgi:acyl dehydratase
VANKALIGREFPSVTAAIDAESVKAFARALGESDPLYLDDEAAKKGPFGAIVAPPTYPIAFMAQAMAGAASSSSAQLRDRWCTAGRSSVRPPVRPARP